MKVNYILLKLSLLIAVLFIQIPNIYGQNFIIRTFTTDNGLPHNNIRSLARDSSGFLWVGTWDGLSRFDGYDFKNYYHVPGDSTSLPYFSVLNLVVDGANNLWILTESKQIVYYDRDNDRFVKMVKAGDKILNDIYNISADGNGDLWIICKDELIRRAYKTDVISHFETSDINGERFDIEPDLYSITLSGSDKIWLCGSTVYEFGTYGEKPSASKVILKNKFKVESSISKERIDFDFITWYHFYESSLGTRWVFSNIGLFRYDESKSAFCEYKGLIRQGEFSGKGIFEWGWYNKGLFVFDPVMNKAKPIAITSCCLANAVLRQGKNMIWYSSTSTTGTSMGLSQLVFTPDYFKNYLLVDQGETQPAVYSIVKDDKDNILAGIRGKDHIIEIAPDGNIQKTGFLDPDLFRAGGHIRSMVKVRNGIWIGYYLKLLMFYDFSHKQFKRYTPDETSFRTITTDKDGKLYIGTQRLSHYDPLTGKTDLIWKSPTNQNIYKLLLDDKDILWAGLTTSELLRYNTLTKRIDLFTISRENYHIEDICPGDEGYLWLATLGGGICKFNPETGETRFYTTSSGLSNNTTYSILKDKGGMIWISTDDGISRLDPNTGYIRTFGMNDGLEIKEFNSDASYVGDDGEFFFGGMGGFVSFYPDSVSGATGTSDKQKILITDLKVSGEVKLFPEPVNESDTLALSKGENNFHITFSSTDFANVSKTKYRYKLSDINRSWIETDSRNRNINYSNLKPAWYKLIIESTDVNGNWTAGRELKIRIAPYFYQTRLFKVSIPSLAAAIMVFSLITYLRQIKQRERLKQDELKLQSLRGQMNPHFIFNSLNSINYFISNNDRMSANRYIADFSRLIRTILSNLGKNYIPYEKEISSLNDYLAIEHLRFGDKFDFEIITLDEGNPFCMEVLPGIIQPFIENAIWHGVRPLENRKGKIVIRFLASGQDRIKCIIEDNGIGRKASMEAKDKHSDHRSMGIEIVRERLLIIGKMRHTIYDLEIRDLYTNRFDTGTLVKVDLPIKLC